MLNFKTKEGNKNEYGKDMVLTLETKGEHKITMTELLFIIKFFFDNENRIYPKEKGFLGDNLLFNEILKIKFPNKNE